MLVDMPALVGSIVPVIPVPGVITEKSARRTEIKGESIGVGGLSGAEEHRRNGGGKYVSKSFGNDIHRIGP